MNKIILLVIALIFVFILLVLNQNQHQSFSGAEIIDETADFFQLRADLPFVITKHCSRGNLAWGCYELLVTSFQQEEYHFFIGGAGGSNYCLNQGPPGECNSVCYKDKWTPDSVTESSLECQTCLRACRNRTIVTSSELIYGYLAEYNASSNTTLPFVFTYDRKKRVMFNFSSSVTTALNISLHRE